MAIYKGILLAWDLDFLNLVCYNDSKMALDLVERKCNHSHSYPALIQSMKDLLKDWSVRLLHSWREGNAAADLLA